MTRLSISLLGSPQIERDGEPLEIGASKALALLAYLAVTGRVHSRDALSTMLWSESDQSRARTYLRHALWTLKKNLGERWLQVSREQIGFVTGDDVWLDVAAFQQKLAAVAAHDHGDDERCARCLQELEAAVALYHDDFLAGFTLPDAPAFDEWHFFQTEALRQMLARALEQLVQLHIADGSYAAAIPFARRWLALDPLQESVQRTLMRLYARSGQQAAALRQYDEVVRLLAEELAIKPAVATQALYEAIRTRRLAPAPAAHRAKSERSSPSPRELPPFVAREAELTRLDAMMRAAHDGQPQMAFVLGEAGQGKTALLQAFAQRALETYPALLVAGGNCNAYTGRGDPYLPFREILAVLTGDLEAWSPSGVLQPELGRRLQRFLPYCIETLLATAPDLLDTFVPLAGVVARSAVPRFADAPWQQRLLARARQSPPRDPDAKPGENTLLEEVARLLQSLAGQAPLLLVIDDLQWADPGSVALIFHLGRRLAPGTAADGRFFLVGAYRPDEVAVAQEGENHPLARVIPELQRLFGEVTIDLGQAEGKAFVNAWVDREPNRLESFFRQTLYRQTGGHPLFTIELLRAMRERGDLRQDANGVWEMETKINWNAMPARVEGVIGERISRLAPEERTLLQVASVEGEAFTAEVAARVLDRDERATAHLLSRKLDKVHALVQAVGTRRRGAHRLSRYRFRHILIQRYLYNLLDEVERAYLHEAVGRALEAVYGEQVAAVAVQLARHFELAQQPEKAARYLHLAGDQARRTAALQEAIRFYQAALTHWPEEDRAGRATVLRRLGECLWMTGQSRDALATLQTAYELYEELNRVEEAGALQRLIGRVYWEIGEREQSLRHYQRALQILEPLTDSVERAWAISSMAQMHMLAGEHEQAIAWGERALTQARQLQAEAVIVHALNNVGTSYLNSGQLAQGRPLLEESIRRALDANLPHDACRGQLNLGEGLASFDRYEEARETFANLYAYAERVHTALYAGSSLVELARLDWLNGHWRAALAQTASIEAWLEQGQTMAYVHVIAATVFGQEHNDLGQGSAALAVLQQSLATVRSFDEFQLTSPYLVQYVRALVAGEEEKQALEVARELLATFARWGYDSRFTSQSLLTLCDALPAGALEPLLQEITLALDNLGKEARVADVASRQAALLESRGTVAYVQERLAQAADVLREAVILWKTVARPYDQARALSKLGQTLLLTGKDDRAQEAFARAHVLIEALAAQLDDSEQQASFLQTPLARAIEEGRSS